MTDSKSNDVFVPEGMPKLDDGGRVTSFFEFWPSWVVYLPVLFQWFALSVRYRSLTLPLIANPGIPLSGMVGVAKTEIFKQAGSEARRWILPWMEYEVTLASPADQGKEISDLLDSAGLQLPVVAKPNVGCRGAGVKLLQSMQQLALYVEGSPRGSTIQFQKLADWEAEAGVFYVRHPDQATGEITSLTFKYMPYVVGDGKSTLEELVSRDVRAGKLIHLYYSRHKHMWQKVLSAGKPYRLVFSASHCRGAIFRDGRGYITEKLSAKLDKVLQDIPGFHYGRLDIKFRDLASLMEGENFAIIEINGASSESIHIWDRDARFLEAVKTLMTQYRTLFQLGHANRELGHQPPGIASLWKAWRHEANLTRSYPAND